MDADEALAQAAKADETISSNVQQVASPHD
jgi:hypothetical protein